MGERVTVDELLDVAEELGFEAEEQSKYWKVGDTRGLRVYVKKASLLASEVQFAGFSLDCDEVTQLSEAEARDRHLGNVRGMIESHVFKSASRATILELFRRGLDELVEKAHVMLSHARGSREAPVVAVASEPVHIDDRLLDFKGYGRSEGTLWFLGIEEGFGGRLSNPGWTVQRELDARAGWPSVADTRDAGVALEDRYWERRNYSMVWRNAGKLARALVANAADWLDTNRAHDYVVEKLGRLEGDVFLGELFPLPAIGLHHWPYASRWRDRDEYREQVWAQRREMWCEHLAASKPSLVICYGADVRPYACELFGCAEKRGVYAYAGPVRVVFAPFIGGRTSEATLEAIVAAARG